MRAGVGHGPMTIAEFPCTTPCEHSDHMTPNGGRGGKGVEFRCTCHVVPRYLVTTPCGVVRAPCDGRQVVELACVPEGI